MKDNDSEKDIHRKLDEAYSGMTERDWLRWVVTSPQYVIPVVGLCTVISIMASVISNDWTWFQRVGSILTVAGAILSARAVITTGQASRPQYAAFRCKLMGYDEKTGKMQVENPASYYWQKLEVRLDTIAARSGLPMLLIGTLVWGYGDKIAWIFK